MTYKNPNYHKDLYQNDPEFRKRRILSARRSKLKCWYNVTLNQYQQMFERQNGVCAICKRPERAGKWLALDHDRSCCKGTKSCGKCIRGLLCFYCNTRLEVLEGAWTPLAQEYLKKGSL